MLLGDDLLIDGVGARIRLIVARRLSREDRVRLCFLCLTCAEGLLQVACSGVVIVATLDTGVVIGGRGCLLVLLGALAP